MSIQQYQSQIQALPLVQQYNQLLAQNQQRQGDPAFIAQMQQLAQRIQADPQYQAITTQAQQFQQQQMQGGGQGMGGSVGDMAMRDPSGAFSTGGQAQTQGAQNQFTEQEIREFLTANPDLTDVEIAQLMDQYGVTTSQIARASGQPMDEATRRYSAARAQYNPLTGLIGTEQALTQGLASARQDINQGTAQARQDIQAGTAGAERLLREGYQEGTYNQLAKLGEAEALMREAYGAGTEEFRRAESMAANAIGSANDSALAELVRGRQDIQSGTDQAVRTLGQGQQFFQPYVDTGRQALGVQSALSGAQGQQAFDQAYVESPYIRFLQEQGDRSVTRNAAALGGLGGGNVMKELTRFGQGLAGQGIQQQIGNLQNLSTMGMQGADASARMSAAQAEAQRAAGGQLANQSNIAAQQRANTGASLANVFGQTGANIGALNQSLGREGAQMYANAGTNLLGFAGDMSRAAASNTYGSGLNLGNAAQSQGNLLGSYNIQGGNLLAGARESAGNSLANALAGFSTNMGNLAQNQGQGVSNVYGTSGTQLATILQQAGLSQADIARIMAQSQASTAQTGSGQFAGLPGLPGTQEQSGFIGRTSQGIGTALAGL
jgi:hypothetical protein